MLSPSHLVYAGAGLPASAGLPAGAIFNRQGTTFAAAFPDADKVRSCRSLDELRAGLLYAISLGSGVEQRCAALRRDLQHMAQLEGLYYSLADVLAAAKEPLSGILALGQYALRAAGDSGGSGGSDGGAGSEAGGQSAAGGQGAEGGRQGAAGEGQRAPSDGGPPLTVTAERISGPSLRGGNPVQVWRFCIEVRGNGSLCHKDACLMRTVGPHGWQRRVGETGLRGRPPLKLHGLPSPFAGARARLQGL